MWGNAAIFGGVVAGLWLLCHVAYHFGGSFFGRLLYGPRELVLARGTPLLTWRGQKLVLVEDLWLRPKTKRAHVELQSLNICANVVTPCPWGCGHVIDVDVFSVDSLRVCPCCGQDIKVMADLTVKRP